MSIKKLIVIAGPTASGKTDLAIQIAKLLNTEIISFDSRQFFKELHIGTARPLENEWQGVKHHCLGHKSIHEKYSVGDFEKEGFERLKELFKNRNTLVAVGGSGLYINALLYGLDDLPEADTALRNQLNSELINKGLGYIQTLLEQYDPEYYKEVDINNPQRMVRALEVSMSVGVPYSSFRKQSKVERDFFPIKYAIDIERSTLYNRINLRVDQMMKHGLLEEVKANMANKHLNALNTVGYKELYAHFDGLYSLQEAIDKIKQHTRNFAKRQITWFKHQDQYKWLSADAILNEVKSLYV
jgi:tRNA dimethylallyltransferase